VELLRTHSDISSLPHRVFTQANGCHCSAGGSTNRLALVTEKQCVFCEVKDTGHPITGHEDPGGEETYGSALFLTSALDGVSVKHHTPADLHLGKTLYPLYRRVGGPQGRTGQMRKFSPPPGFDPRTVYPVASRCTD